MRDMKVRAWDKHAKKMIYKFCIGSVTNPDDPLWTCPTTFNGVDWVENDMLELMLFTGLKDNLQIELYKHDICEFENGDRFIIDCEEWIEFYVKWITKEPKCENQARDFYRIRNSRKIGDKYSTPELLEDK